ncbi:hypothetical protein D3C80_1509900 [compost metagenome]
MTTKALLQHAANGGGDTYSQMFAIIATPECNAIAKGNIDLKRTRFQHPHQMGQKGQRARPSYERTMITPHRHAVNTGIGNSNWLNIDNATRHLFHSGGCSAKQR